MGPVALFLALLYAVLPLYVAVRLLLSRGRVFRGTGCLGGCLGMVVGFFGVLQLASWLSAGEGGPNAGGVAFLPAAVLCGAWLGCALAPLMQPGETRPGGQGTGAEDRPDE